MGTSCVVVRLSQSRAILVGLTWYGYAHKILCPGDGINAFTACRWLLDTLVVATGVYILRRRKQSRAAESLEPPQNFDESPKNGNPPPLVI